MLEYVKSSDAKASTEFESEFFFQTVHFSHAPIFMFSYLTSIA